jgi:broad specificity phosphatase PhoE
MNLNIDFYQKYIKYKIKYSTLKNLIGGENKITSILVTHNGRLRCLFKQFGYDVNKKKFKNCAIIKFELDKTELKISLIYEGELDKEKKTENKTKEKDSYFDKSTFTPKTIKGDELNKILNDLKLKPTDLESDTYTFYIVRHGHGVHNEAKDTGLFEKVSKTLSGNLTDANLTDSGKEQAKKAGKELKSELGDKNVNFSFVSDLYRTQETLENLVSQFNNGSDILQKAIVLPCSHELDFVKDGSCDGKQKFTASENTMSCTVNKIGKFKCKNNYNWNYYYSFYGDKSKLGTRNDNNPARCHCSDTSMISMSIFIIKNPIQPNMLDKSTEIREWITHRKT